MKWPPVIIPLGKALGAKYAVEARPGDAPTHYEVHLGDEIVNLNREQWIVWALAHTSLMEHAQHVFDRTALRGAIAADSDLGESADRVIDEAFGLKVIAQVNLSLPERDDFLRRHRLIPTATGLGGDPKLPGRYWLALNGQPIMHVDLLAYDLWALSYLEGSIWAGCASYVTDDGGPPFDALSVDEAADGICEDLAAIVASGCGYLDVLP